MSHKNIITFHAASVQYKYQFFLKVALKLEEHLHQCKEGSTDLAPLGMGGINILTPWQEQEMYSKQGDILAR